MAQTGSRPASAGKEDRQERSLALKVIGWGLILCDLLVFFFVPASFKVGNQRVFLGIIFGLLIAGLALVFAGSKRGKG